MKIYLCRHGQTTGDLEDRYGGDYEDHLTDEGKAQVQSLADKLANKNIEVIFTSPRIRALETSQILNDKLAVEVKTLQNLRERNHYGILTGLVKSQAKEQYPDEVEKVKDYKNTATNGENYADFTARIQSVWKELQDSGHQTIAVVSHGGPIRFIFREILKLGEIKIADCAFAEIDIGSTQTTVISLDGIGYVV